MSKLKWDDSGKRLYETGLDHGVLFVMGPNKKYLNGIPWNGLTAITESPSGADPNPLYADNIKYLNLIAAEDFGATVEAYTYPDEFSVCDGSASPIPGLNIGQQARKTFGLAYRTKVGNDILGQEYGYKIHLIYGALASPSEKGYQTVNDSPEAISFSWTINTTPVDIPGFKPAACIVIDSRKTTPALLNVLEGVIFGRDAEPGTIHEDPVEPIESTLPSPEALLRIINTGSPFEELTEDLLDDTGDTILDDLGETILASRMILIS